MVPLEDGEPWPTLGPQVCAQIETELVFGPGDLRGRRAVLDPEKRALIYSFYEVFPPGSKDSRGNPIDGRRRFRRCCWSAQKGSAKTELAAWVAAEELSSTSQVRFDRWSNGKPLGRPVIDPYIPMVAYTEEQSEDLAYGALRVILDQSAIAAQFDIGMERILRARGDGKAAPLAGAPDSRDGARTSFSHKDETHRWILARQKKAAQTMNQNLPKRYAADPWDLETTTSFAPGEKSVAEDTATYAEHVADGRIKDSRLFFFHRQARDGYNLTDPEQRRAAVIEAAGPMASWKDIDGIADMVQDPEIDLPYWERVWLNRPTMSSSAAFNSEKWKEGTAVRIVPDGSLITLGFDGSRVDDATALIATEVESGYQWVVGIWAQDGAPDWEVDSKDVDAKLDDVMQRYQVWRMYADPSKWESEMSTWAGRYGATKVVAWSTTLYRKMAAALRSYANAIEKGEVTNDGSRVFAAHIGNAVKNLQNFVDDDNERMWLIAKDRKGSQRKIDAAMAGSLSWQARLEAVAAGAKATGGWILR